MQRDGSFPVMISDGEAAFSSFDKGCENAQQEDGISIKY
jgi:hypothetical protein